jgi:hypothetical protein
MSWPTTTYEGASGVSYEEFQYHQRLAHEAEKRRQAGRVVRRFAEREEWPAEDAEMVLDMLIGGDLEARQQVKPHGP